jgi:deoxyribodipyrimidine photolyase-related protein
MAGGLGGGDDLLGALPRDAEPPARASGVKTLRVLLGDQLTPGVGALSDLDPATDVVLMIEAREEATYVPHHKQKIALVLSAMRHFAQELAAQGVAVDYIRLDDPANTGSLTDEFLRAVARRRPARAVIAEPGEWRVREAASQWEARAGLPVEIREDDRFFATHARFDAFARGRKSLRMEFFYRELRRETGLLMRDGEPLGGRWNFDPENRKALPRGAKIPARRRFPPDAITREVLDLVEARFPDHFGETETFGWPVTRADALLALQDFIDHGLAGFGDYQDAMKAGAPFLFHALLAPALNIGLLTPREVCARAAAAYDEGRAPLAAVEGFIRQILGWREYVRGVYWRTAPDYGRSNALDAARPLPAFYWSGETRMNCIAEVVRQTRRHAYAHHIQRLMVTGNFALLAGLRPSEVEQWYLAVYADAFEWVELPNTHGMALFADGGLLASKPYAASGAYIDRMSDYCAGCAYEVKTKAGPRACPFNYLYWAFLIRNETLLSKNPRMAMPYRTLAGWSAQRRDELLAQAAAFLDELEPPGRRERGAGNKPTVTGLS